MILNFFFTFPKKWVGRAMGNETFYGDGLSNGIINIWINFCRINPFAKLTTVFVDTRLWKTKPPWKRFQNFRQSCVLLTDRIEWGGRGQGGQNLPPPVHCSPASRTFNSCLPPFTVLLPNPVNWQSRIIIIIFI